MKKVITQCEFKKDGKCTYLGRRNVVDEFDDNPPILTPVMALQNYKKDKFHILPVPDFLTWRKNLPVYVVFDKNPTDDKYRAWVPDSCCGGGTISSASTIAEVHMRFYPDKDISEVPLVLEAVLEFVFREARSGSFSSEDSEHLATKFNILGFGGPHDYADGLKYRVAAAQGKSNTVKKPPMGHTWCSNCGGPGIMVYPGAGEDCPACGGTGYERVKEVGGE